ncbi:hypothetical protein FAJ39_07025 [Streptococcus suis]|uniref:Uncharacterized protein n=1 Tax=Streptococcus suis TaxID=1307 RepID=A0A4T2GKW9_STRSU|nr:hypothetical protein FAJ39_07025 [Streptococcus suis]
MIRSDLKCETRTNLPINHCAEMLTQTLSNKTKLFNHHISTLIEHGLRTVRNITLNPKYHRITQLTSGKRRR